MSEEIMSKEQEKQYNLLKKWFDEGADTSEITFCTLGNLGCLIRIIEKQSKEIEHQKEKRNV